MDPSFKYFLESPKGRGTEKHTKKHFPELYEQVKQCSGSKWTEKLYNFYHPNEKHICPVCGRSTKFKSLTFGYNGYCSTRCTANSTQAKEKKKQTNLKRYGSENPMRSEIIKHRLKQTNLERYGVEYASQSAVIKDRIKQTNLERYGVENPMRSEIIKHRLKQTNLERYGVVNPFQSNSIKEKIKKSNQHRQINTHPDLLGYMEDGSWICKCPDPKCNKCTEKCYITKSQIYYSRLNGGVQLCTHLLPIQPSYSTFELEVREYLDSLNVAHQDNIRGIIGPKELDIYIPDKKLAIECNGSYWHSIECDREPSDPNYHIDKYLKCKEKGIKLITIWDDWWAQNRSECEALIQYHLGLINAFHPTHLPTDTTDTNLHPTDRVVPVKVNHSGFDCWVGHFGTIIGI